MVQRYLEPWPQLLHKPFWSFIKNCKGKTFKNMRNKQFTSKKGSMEIKGKAKPKVPRVVCSIMYIFHSTSIYNFFPWNWRTLYSPNHETKLSHGTMILCTTIQTHACILFHKDNIFLIMKLNNNTHFFNLDVVRLSISAYPLNYIGIKWIFLF